MTQPPTRPRSGRAAQTPDSTEEDGENGPITRAAVLLCALEIIDRDGVDALSMRRLGEAVGRDQWCCIGMCRARPRCSTGWSS